MVYDFTERNKNILVTRHNRNRQNTFASIPPRIIKEKPNSILLTGGIGDVLALESYFTQYDRDNLATIYYATNKSQYIIEIFKSLNNFPKLKNHIVIWDDFSNFWCFFSKDECVVYLKTKGHDFPKDFLDAEDWSIAAKFPRINSGIIKYNGSSLFNQRLCNISDYDLPSDYIVICPCSTDKRHINRDFTASDWENTVILLHRFGMKGVVLNKGMDIHPVYPEIIDLSNKTSIVEAIEILKNSKGYIGVNSVLSVLAAKLFSFPNLIVKSTDDHCFKNKHIYYAPHIRYDFLVDRIRS